MNDTDAEIIERALDLLRTGLLASEVPERLMSEYSITLERAMQLVSAAIKRRLQEASQAGKGT